MKMNALFSKAEIMKMGVGTDGDCSDQGLPPFCAGASPHFLGTQGVPLQISSDGDIRGANTLGLKGGADPIYFTLQGG